MGINSKDITITLRIDEETDLKLKKLCKIEQNNALERSWRGHEVKKSQMIRCLIEGIYEMPEEARKEWLAEHYHLYG